MPIISEGNTPARYAAYIDRNGSHGTLSVKSGKHISQTGYRSGQLSAAEQAAIESKLQLKDTRSGIAYLEEVGYQYALRQNRPFLVHDRTAIKTTYSLPGRINWVADLHRGASLAHYDMVGCIAVETLNPGSVIPAQPSWTTLQSVGGDMLRQSVPQPSSFTLARSLGELRDAKLIARGLNLKGLAPDQKEKFLISLALSKAGKLGGTGFNPGDLSAASKKKLLKKGGELFLTWVFGIAPTLGDLNYVAETIIRHDGHIKRYIEDQERNIRTSSKRSFWSDVASGQSVSRFSQGGTNNFSINLGPATLKCAYLQIAGTGSSLNVLAPILDWSWKGSQSLRTFANWEFFVPQPTKLPERAATYKEKAEKILGEGVSAATVYDLQPYTWMADWFFDVGGILHYQEALNNNQVASKSSGLSFYEKLGYRATFAGFNYDSTGTLSPYILDRVNSVSASTTADYSHHERRGGSPYSVGPTWAFNAQQWSILGALGLSKFPL